MNIPVRARVNLSSTIRSIGERRAGEVFDIPEGLAKALEADGLVERTVGGVDPKEPGLSHGGPLEQPASSLPVAQASATPKRTTSGRRQRKASVAR